MTTESAITRRDFLKDAAKTTALSGITFLAHPERVLGANDRVRVGVCGLNRRGKDHLSAFSRLSKVEIAALCDADENVLRKRQGEVSGSPQTYVDIGKLLDDKSIDAISIATPNHWHCLMAIWACQAGKDVYVEKPCSHNLWEGLQLVHAAEKYKRIVQHTARRSGPRPRSKKPSKGFTRAQSAKCIWRADCASNSGTRLGVRLKNRFPRVSIMTSGRDPLP